MNTMATHDPAVKAPPARSGETIPAVYRAYEPKQPEGLTGFDRIGTPWLMVKRPASSEIPAVTATTNAGAETDLCDEILQTPAGYSGREQRLNRYIGTLRESGEISLEMASRAWRAWQILRGALSNTLPVPDASSGRNGEFLYIWDRADHHLEMEISADGTADFFYANRVTGNLWGAEYRIGDPLTQDALEKFKLFG